MPKKSAETEANGQASKKARIAAPTVKEIEEDEITQIAKKHWACEGKAPKFDAKLVNDIYAKDLAKANVQRVMMLEVSSYLEKYLWPNYDPQSSSLAHTMSLTVVINEKFREGVPILDTLSQDEKKFKAFFATLFALKEKHELSVSEKRTFLIFFTNMYQSLEHNVVREIVLRLVSLPLWKAVNGGRVNLELSLQPGLKKHWKEAEKKTDKALGEIVTFFPSLFEEYFAVLESINDESTDDRREKIDYCVSFVQFMIDLMAQLTTRRFFRVLLDDSLVHVRSSLSYLGQDRNGDGKLFCQLLDMLKFYIAFEINDQTGEPLTTQDVVDRETFQISVLQRIVFQKFESEHHSIALATIGTIRNRETFAPLLNEFSDEQLVTLARHLRFIAPAASQPKASPKKGKGSKKTAQADPPSPIPSREVLTEAMLSRFEGRISQLRAISRMPLYPTEDILWDEDLVPSDQSYNGNSCLALPKLNLQFLTFYDYLLRNFTLFRLESTYEIRDEVEDVVRRCAPRLTEEGQTQFTGWARMSVPIIKFRITHVKDALVGESAPASVNGEIKFSLTTTKDIISREWDQLKQHDVLFLLSVAATTREGEQPMTDNNESLARALGLEAIRGCEVVCLLDEEGNLIENGVTENGPAKGTLRTIKVKMDASQFYLDDQALRSGKVKESVYETFGLLMRRKPKENNFKAILECIRDLMKSEKVTVPAWLHDVFLGYGDPAAAHYKSANAKEISINFNDTFLDLKHVEESFPKRKVVVSKGSKEPPFRVTVPNSESGSVKVESYSLPNPGPYPEDQPKRNNVRFTPTQVEALISGSHHGLTMVVGPPGTGKTDVAVQILSNLYHNHPNQRTVLVTHSNQALNDIFEKLMVKDIPERYLLRLGHGGESLETEKDFTRFGRVNFMLGRRVKLLDEVQRLALSLGVQDTLSYTCETAGYFFLWHVLSRWEKFVAELESKDSTSEKVSPSIVKDTFPFNDFFSNAPTQPLFKGKSREEDWEVAQGCWKHIEELFTEVKECAAFELLRTQNHRTEFLITQQAKIIAMTCTHAALKRSHLVEMGFHYDNIVMEEAAQVLEIETFIPMMLQDQKDGCRLKRAVLIGDHNQLPPVVKNMAFQKFAHMDQSLFTRFVRLGCPTVDLDRQGRARPSLANLVRWRYDGLDDLALVKSVEEYKRANAGFAHPFQFINVENYDGRGETTPIPHFYQNLGEAEYACAVFQYMRLVGIPAEKISVITTYNGQKSLLRDVFKARSSWNAMFGSPAKITTVDKFQGQQNDYIILSLVRTRTVGHVRDIRRLIVAMSRARLGLIVFGRQSLFENCFELTPVFEQLLAKPTTLQLVEGEAHPTKRKEGDKISKVKEIKDVKEMGVYVSTLLQSKMQGR